MIEYILHKCFDRYVVGRLTADEILFGYFLWYLVELDVEI